MRPPVADHQPSPREANACAPRRFALGSLGAAALALLSGCSGTAVLDKLVSSSTYRLTPGVAYGPQARNLPVRPRPVWISSAMNSVPCLRQSASACGR